MLENTITANIEKRKSDISNRYFNGFVSPFDNLNLKGKSYLEVISRIHSFRELILNNIKSTARIVQQKLGKVPNNTKSTAKLSYIRELVAILKKHQDPKMIDIKKLVEDHPATFILSIIMTTIGLTYAVVTYFENAKNESTINGYKTTISSIERRIGGKESIDISKLITLTSSNQLTTNSQFYPKDNFFATKDTYWTYKYTNPGELICIKNGVLPPKELVNNPMDMPLHILPRGWCPHQTLMRKHTHKCCLPPECLVKTSATGQK